MKLWVLRHSFCARGYKAALVCPSHTLRLSGCTSPNQLCRLTGRVFWRFVEYNFEHGHRDIHVAVRAGGGVLDLSGFGNRMRGEPLAWCEAFARMWSEVAPLPVTCMRLPIFSGMTRAHATRLQAHCALPELPCITSLHLTHDHGPLYLWLSLLPNLQELHGPEIASNARVGVTAILPVFGHGSGKHSIATLLERMSLRALHYDCGVIDFELFECIHEGAARCDCLTSLKLPAKPTQHSTEEHSRQHALSLLTGLRELSCPMYITHDGVPQSIMHAVDDVCHLTSLSKLTLKGYDSRECHEWDTTAPADISEVLHAVCCTSSKLPAVKSLHFELSHVSIAADSFGRVETHHLAAFGQCLEALDDFTLRESESFYHTLLLFPLLAQLHSVNCLRSVAVFDLALDWNDIILRPVNWNALSRLSGLTALQLTFNSLLPVACASGLADALACMHDMRELDIDFETLWCREEIVENGSSVYCADPTIVPQITCMQHLASLRLHVLQPVRDPGWGLSLRRHDASAAHACRESHPHAYAWSAGFTEGEEPWGPLPMARSLTSVDLRGVHDRDGACLAAVLSQCSAVQRLALGNVAFGGTAQLGFLSAMPGLRSLELELHMSVVVEVDLGVLGGMLGALRRLSSLELRCSYLDCVGAEELGRQLRGLERLERLELRHLCSDDFEATWPEVLGLRVPMRILREH